MSVSVLKRLVTTHRAGESTEGRERVKELNLREWDVTAQSIPLQGTDGVRASGLCPKGDETIPENIYEGVDTLYTSFQRGLKLSRNNNCLGWRNSGAEGYQWLSYEEVHKRTRAFGSGLLKHGVEVGQDTRLGIFSKNCVEWVLVEQAASMFSMVVVPFYDSLSGTACSYICNTTEMKVLVCDTEENASKLLEAPESVPTLKTIVAIKKFSDEFIQKAGEKGIKILQFKDVEATGSEDLQEPVSPKPDDVCTICFTSGTTGNPKGVILTHRNILCASTSTIIVTSERFEFQTGDVLISYLPLAHMYERYLQVSIFMHGASVGFFRGDPKLLLDDMACLKPTIFPCVPRVMNKLYDKVMAIVSEKSKFSQLIFRKAYEAKKKEILSGTLRDNGWWDYVFKRIRKLHGGNIRFITSGAAPISPEIKMFFRIIFGCLVLEGYGQTETAAPVTVTHPNDLSDNHVGMIIPMNVIKLIDAPELEYFAEKGQGEVCVKGPSTFKGYYRDPEKTNETIDKDGFVHTGDIGEWLPNGQLKIIDRVKHIFKLSQGEYVAPERVENIYVRTEGVAQVFVHGESLEDYCVAIVVPDEEWVTKIAGQRQWEEKDFTALCHKQELKDLLFEKMTNLAESESDLKGFERVKKIHVHPVLFSVENDLLTPTFKSKRPNLRKHFRDTFDEMYNDLRGQKKMQTNGASSSGQKEDVGEDKEDRKDTEGNEKEEEEEEEAKVGEDEGEEAEEKSKDETEDKNSSQGGEEKKEVEEEEKKEDGIDEAQGTEDENMNRDENTGNQEMESRDEPEKDKDDTEEAANAD